LELTNIALGRTYLATHQLQTR